MKQNRNYLAFKNTYLYSIFTHKCNNNPHVLLMEKDIFWHFFTVKILKFVQFKKS